MNRSNSLKNKEARGANFRIPFKYHSTKTLSTVFIVIRATKNRSEKMSEDFQYNVIKLIEQDPEISQRELSRELGVSLGKVNYCLHALIDKGWIKAKNFKNSSNKLAYRYLLTPKGVQQKTVVAANFLKRKLAEYEQLQLEIESLRQDVEQLAVQRQQASEE